MNNITINIKNNDNNLYFKYLITRYHENKLY